MGKRLVFEDVATIALLQYYKATNRNILSLNKIKEFDIELDKKLNEMNSTVQCVHPIDRSKLIYFYSRDDNNNEYLVLKHDFNYDKCYDYFLLFPADIYNAVRSNEVLRTLNIEIVNNNMQIIHNTNKLEFYVNWQDIVLLISLLGSNKIQIDNTTTKELLETYYYGIEHNVATGFNTDEILVKNKNNLYNYLIKSNIIKQENIKQLKKIKN